MNECPICQHQKIRLIEERIRQEVPLEMLSWTFHLAMNRLREHREHMAPTPMERFLAFDAAVPEPKTQALSDDPLQRLQHAWRDAQEDARMRARMVAWLNEQLQQDEMGLS